MPRIRATELAPGVVRIPTAGRASINSFAVVGDEGVTLVDCGLRRAPARIVAGLRAAGFHPGDVRRIVLTHAHTDHAGGLAEMAARTGAPVAVHEADVAAVQAGRPPGYDRTVRLGRLMNRLPGDGFAPVHVDEPLVDGQLLDGGLRVVATPGHTPGSICLLQARSGTLLVGDTLFHHRALRLSPRPLCTDHRQNARAAQVLRALEYNRIGFAHGREITRDAREAVRAALARGDG